MGNEATQPVQASTPAGMGHTVKQQGMQAGVAGQDLPGAARRRVTVKNALDVGAKT